MSWPKWLAIGAGLALLIAVGILAALGLFSSDQSSRGATSVTVGDHTITVDGHYKTMSQETLADGMRIVVDQHVIAATQGELTIDGKSEDLAPGQDVNIFVADNGSLQTKFVSDADTPDSGSK